MLLLHCELLKASSASCCCQSVAGSDILPTLELTKTLLLIEFSQVPSIHVVVIVVAGAAVKHLYLITFLSKVVIF